jgi:hypothetical protein
MAMGHEKRLILYWLLRRNVRLSNLLAKKNGLLLSNDEISSDIDMIVDKKQDGQDLFWNL